jgi:hypothetical protein
MGKIEDNLTIYTNVSFSDYLSHLIEHMAISELATKGDISLGFEKKHR